jgi:hypothetical protein
MVPSCLSKAVYPLLISIVVVFPPLILIKQQAHHTQQHVTQQD